MDKDITLKKDGPYDFKVVFSNGAQQNATTEHILLFKILAQLERQNQLLEGLPYNIRQNLR